MTTNDLIEDWIQIRATLQRQVRMLESGESHGSDATAATIAHLKTCISELNALLKEYSRVDHA